MKTTIISALVIIGMAVTLWLGGCFAGGQKASLEQLPVNLSGVYGAPNNTADVWPIWSVQVFFVRNNVFGDYVGPVTVQIQLKNKPTLEDVQRYITLPVRLRGTWSVDAIYNVVQIGVKEQPTPTR